MVIKLDLVAIKKNGKVFVKGKEKYDTNFESVKLRFDVEELESFHKDWKVFSSVPTTAEQFKKGSKSIIKYKLKYGFTPTDRTPVNMTKEAFRCCDDECENNEIRGLYEPVYRHESDEWVFVEMEIELIDSDCEPLIETKYEYFIKFPGYIDKHMIVHHTIPCYIKGDDAFDYIVKEVKEHIPDHCFISSDFDFHLCIEKRIPISNKEPLENKTKKVIDISKARFQYGNTIRDIEAKNYNELENKMDQKIKWYLDQMEQKIAVCPTCNGCGWVDEHE